MYVNKRALFANVPLVFNSKDVTKFLKELEQRLAFY